MAARAAMRAAASQTDLFCLIFSCRNVIGAVFRHASNAWCDPRHDGGVRYLQYVALQRIYRKKAADDIAAITTSVTNTLESLGKPVDFISATEIKTFCKNAGSITTTNIVDEWSAEGAFARTRLGGLGRHLRSTRNGHVRAGVHAAQSSSLSLSLSLFQSSSLSLSLSPPTPGRRVLTMERVDPMRAGNSTCCQASSASRLSRC
jgi:hypothetical protein